MRFNSFKSAALLLAVLPLAFTACVKDKDTITYTLFKPVFKEKSEVIAQVGSHAPRTISQSGKIYLYNQYIFLNDLGKGVHVIDNSNPATPQRIAFIDIPGNIDIAVKGNILYADLYSDMLAIDISNPLNAKITKQVSNVFPERNQWNPFYLDSSKYIVDWIKKDTTVTNTEFRSSCNGCVFSLANASASSVPKANISAGGSMSRFAIVNDFLYTVSSNSLRANDISVPADPQFKSIRGLGWDIETIYPFKDKLFIGSASGMFIFDINDPAQPVFKSAFSHALACDPVVADDSYAYVTLRAGTSCRGGDWSNQLDVINVQNLTSPALVRTYSLVNPYGLGKDGNLLWVCDGKAGLKLFDASNPGDLKQLKVIGNIEAYDVITLDGKMIVTAKDGLFQYDYSDTNDIRLISKIPITKS